MGTSKKKITKKKAVPASDFLPPVEDDECVTEQAGRGYATCAAWSSLSGPKGQIIVPADVDVEFEEVGGERIIVSPDSLAGFKL